MDYSSYYGYDVSPYARAAESSVTSADAEVLASVSAVLGAFAGIVMVFALVISILQIVAMWKLYVKAGEKGWKSIIPIYNLVVLYKICGITPWLLFVYLASFVPYVGWIAVLALSIYQANQLSKSFGKDAGYTVGLVLIPTIFYLILGFGSSQYVGPGGNNGPKDEPIDVTTNA